MLTNQESLLQAAYHNLLIISLVFFACMLILCLIRAIKGPRIADRVLAVNMMGTMVMVMIAILGQYLGESYLVDICLIYAMISFLAVIVLSKVYTGVYLEVKRKEYEKIHHKETEVEKLLRMNEPKEDGMNDSTKGKV